MGRIIPGLLALVWTSSVAAATSLHFGPPPQWVRATPIPALGATTSAATKVLLIDEQIELSRRTVSYYLENVVHIQTPQGLSAMGTVKVDWDPDTDVLIVHKIHILRGDKEIDVLGAGQTFTVARREVNLDYAAIDDTLTAILEPSDLEVGDTLDVAYTLQRTDPILAGTSEAVVAIPPEELVTAAHVSVLWPQSDPVKTRAGWCRRAPTSHGHAATATEGQDCPPARAAARPRYRGAAGRSDRGEGRSSEGLHQAQLLTAANPTSPLAYILAGQIFVAFHQWQGERRFRQGSKRGAGFPHLPDDSRDSAVDRPSRQARGHRKRLEARPKIRVRAGYAGASANGRRPVHGGRSLID